MNQNSKLISTIVTCIASQLFIACTQIGANNSTTGCTTSQAHFKDLERAEISNPHIPQQIKEYKGFTVNFNASNRTPNYVSWELLGTETTGKVPRQNNFWRDETLKNCPSSSDYTRSGYDRGHMFPAADAKWDKISMQHCFTMANMCPQAHALNSGAWKTLEEKERLWARRDSALVIIAGPVYRKTDTERIGNAGVRVPSGFFKAIIAPYLPEPRGIAFLYPNDRAPGNMQNYALCIDALEEIIGFDLFSALPDTLENQIESTFNFKTWNRQTTR